MPIFEKFATWPTYAGFGEWSLTMPEKDVPGSGDNRIQEDQLPATQYAIRYNPLSDNISIPSNVEPISYLPSLGLTGFGYEALGTINVSYSSTGTQYLRLEPASESGYAIGIGPPMFNYSIGDQFKECLRYHIEATLFLYVTSLGAVTPISTTVAGWLQYVSRCRFKSFRNFSADIVSVSYVSGRGTNLWTYKLSTSLRNDVLDSLDLSSDSVSATIYSVDSNGSYSASLAGQRVTKIEGLSVYVESAPPANQSKDAPDGWAGGFFELNKAVLVRNPSTLFYDRSDSVTETTLGYETSEQQIQDSSTVRGIYVSKSTMDFYLNEKINDPTTPAADVVKYQESLDYVDGTTVESIPSEGLVYGSFETGTWGTTFLSYLKEIKPTNIILDIAIGDSPNQRHNMSAGCLAGEYFLHRDATTFQTYKVASHIRNNVYELEARSRTSKDDLVQVLSSTADVKTFELKVEASRMWFINDLTFNNQGSGSCNVAAFWGSLSAISTDKTKVLLKTEDSLGDYSSITYLNEQFVVPVSAPSSTANFVQKWNDEKREWYLNGENNNGSYKIKSIALSAAGDSFDIALEGVLADSIVVDVSQKWWISFDKKFEIAGGYSYINCPYLAIEGDTGLNAENQYNLILSGVYTGLPLREKLGSGLVVSIVKENIYQIPGTQVIVYISTASKGSSLSMSRNKFSNTKAMAYVRGDDPLMSLVVRRGSVNYINNLCESLVYYGDAKEVSCPVSGVAGSDQTVTLPADVLDNAISGIRCIPEVVSFNVSNAVVWEIKHGNYAMGYPSTSGIVSTILTRADTGKYATEESDFVGDYKSGTIISKGGPSYILASNINNTNVVNKLVLTISPKKNAPISPKLSSVLVNFIPTTNLVSSPTSPYVYPMNDKMDCVVYTSGQTWVQSGADIIGFDKVTSGKMAETRVFDPVTQIDSGQDGLFAISTFDYKKFAAGTFPIQNSSTPGQKITDMTSISEVDLYKFPFLLVPNITRCSYSYDNNDLFVVGYSNIRPSASSTDFSVLSLVFHRANLLDLSSYPIYAVKGSGGYVFTYCNNDPKYKRIVVAENCYQEFPGDAPIFTDPSLTTGALTIAADEKMIIIVSHQASGFVFFISNDKGANWSYIDDVALTNDAGTPSSPSIKIYDERMWLFYTIGTSLYRKIIPTGKLASLVDASKNKKSSSVQDSSYINLKNSVQSTFNSIKSDFVAEISEQQVSFDIGNERDFHLVYYDTKGIKSIGSVNHGATWDYRPVNF